MAVFKRNVHLGTKDPLIETDDVANKAVTTEKIDNGAITTEKIDNGAITTEKIADGAIDANEIASGAVTSSKIADGAVTTNKLEYEAVRSQHIKYGAVTTEKIADGDITEEKIANGAVTNSKIANGTLTSAVFADNTITGDKIMDNSVPGSKLQDGTIESVDIKDNSLSGAKLVDNSVTGAKLADNAIESRHLQNNSIPADKIKDGTIESIDIKDGTLSGTKIKDGTIESAKLSDGAITNEKIVNNAITTAKLDDNAVTSAKIAGSAVTEGKIAANAVTEDKIANSAISTAKIADNAVTETKIATGAVTATKIPDNTITEGKIANEAITTGKISDNAITEDKLADGAVTTAKLADGMIQQIQTITDAEPIAGSVKPVQSGGVQNELALGAVYDVSAKNPTAGPNSDGKWESLSALLSDANLNTLIPTSVRKGGMSVKFVQSSDNKYIQARCMAQNFTTDVTQWQGVDDEPTADSENLVKSGGVDSQINGIYIFRQSNYLYGNINPNRKWANVGSTAHFACVVFQINNGGTLKVTANDTAAAQFAILNTFTETEIQNGATSDIRIFEEIQVGITKNYQVNAGEYLYFYMGYAPAYSRTPQSVLLNGEDITVIGGLSKRVSSLENAVATIGASVDDKLDKEFTGKNIFDKTNIEEGYFFNELGAKQVTGFPLFVTVQPMPVKQNTDYFINVSSPSCYMVWLTEDKGIILAQKYANTYYRSPMGAAFLAFSGKISDLDVIQIEEGTEGTSYVPYTKIVAEEDIPKIYNKVFEDNFLNPKLYATLASASSGDSLTIPNTPDVVNRYSIGFNCIVGELGEIIISKGERPYNVGKVIINDTNIIEYKPDNTTITTAHGLTISSVLAVNIYPYKSIVFANNIKALSALLVITTNSGKFSKEIFWVGRWSDVNVSFTSGTYTNAILSFGGDWVNQDVWIFADSYGDMWLPYTFEREYKNRIVLSNHSGGGSPDELLVLKNMLKYEKPKKILWMLGMNETDSSSAGTVNATWKSSLDEVIGICNDNEIELHLYTVPNTPSILNSYKNEVVRNSGFPYLDAAKFFGAEEAGSTWYQGLLSSDNVHPSFIGREYFTTLIASYIPEIVS